MDKVYQVFVSSTFDDLRDERREVSNSLAKAGHIAAGMELFPATDQQQLEYIQRIIDRSDYYVVVVAGRYGSEASNGLSFTENECDYARSKGIPILAFLPADPAAIPSGKTETDPSKVAKLEKFKSKLKSGRIVEFWSDKADLCMKVVIAVGQSINLFPGIGWVRGDQAIDPKVLQEAERLRIENGDLRARLSNLEGAEIWFDPKFAPPNTEIECIIKAHHYDPGTERLDEFTFPAKSNLNDLFVQNYDEILTEPTENWIPTVLARFLATVAGQIDSKYSYHFAGEELVVIRNQLEVLGLIRTSSRQGSRGGSYIVWQLTDKGKRYALSQIALRSLSATK